jgi:hypothetical protein
MSTMSAASFKGFRFAVLFLAIFWSRANASSAGEERTMMIACRIRVTPSNDAVRLDAVANGRKDMAGRYRFDVGKSGASGTSHNIQSGDFNLKADQEQVLSTTFLGGSDADHYRARLVLDSKSGSVSCVSP